LSFNLPWPQPFGLSVAPSLPPAAVEFAVDRCTSRASHHSRFISGECVSVARSHRCAYSSTLSVHRSECLLLPTAFDVCV
jgi:hypothetical protein